MSFTCAVQLDASNNAASSNAAIFSSGNCYREGTIGIILLKK